MRRLFTVGIALMLLFLGLGCRAYELQRDQDKMRVALLDLYTNQIIDNLIRAYNGLPIVQLDYTNITGTITHDENASYGGNQTLLTERNNIGVTTLRRFTNFIQYGAMGDQKIQLTVTANPAINNDSVYNAYLEFLQNPERLMVSCSPPPPCAAHIVRSSDIGCEGKRYYWVPSEYKYDFLRLALVTTVQRGQPLSTPEYFENTVARVEDDIQKGYIVIFLKKSIPNDGGKLTVSLANELYVLGFDSYSHKLDGAEVKRGKKIDRLLVKLLVKDGKVIRLQDDPDNPVLGKLAPEEFKRMLEGQTVRIDLTYYRPTIPTTEDLLGAIRHEVGLIRLEQAGR